MADAESDPSGGFDVHLESDFFLDRIDRPPEITDIIFQRRGIRVVGEWLERTGETNTVVYDDCQYESEYEQSYGLHQKNSRYLI